MGEHTPSPPGCLKWWLRAVGCVGCRQCGLRVGSGAHPCLHLLDPLPLVRSKPCMGTKAKWGLPSTPARPTTHQPNHGPVVRRHLCPSGVHRPTSGCQPPHTLSGCGVTEWGSWVCVSLSVYGAPKLEGYRRRTRRVVTAAVGSVGGSPSVTHCRPLPRLRSAPKGPTRPFPKYSSVLSTIF